MLFKGFLNKHNLWETISNYIQREQKNDVSKEILEQKFAYEIGVLALTGEDFDRARYYLDSERKGFLEKWKNFQFFTKTAKHELVSSL